MAPGPESIIPVEMRGRLHLVAPSNRSMQLAASGTSLTLRAATVRDLRDLLPGSIAGLPEAIRRVAVSLTAAGVALDVRVDGKPLMRCGADTQPNWLARLARLPRTRIGLRPLLMAWRS